MISKFRDINLSKIPRNQYISMRQASELLHCSLSTVYAESYKGKLKLSKDDRGICCVLTDDLIEYCNNRCNRIRSLNN